MCLCVSAQVVLVCYAGDVGGKGESVVYMCSRARVPCLV